VGRPPVGVIASKGKVIVASSDRYEGGGGQFLSVLNAADLSTRPLGIPAGHFPRELAITAGGDALLVTNFGSDDIEFIDLARLGEIENNPDTVR
jgi:hypothetical protein